MLKKWNKMILCIITIMLAACLISGCNTQTNDAETTEPYDITYLEYIAMPVAEKQAYMEKFTTTEEKLAFIQWINTEEEKYQATRP